VRCFNTTIVYSSFSGQSIRPLWPVFSRYSLARTLSARFVYATGWKWPIEFRSAPTASSPQDLASCRGAGKCTHTPSRRRVESHAMIIWDEIQRARPFCNGFLPAVAGRNAAGVKSHIGYMTIPGFPRAFYCEAAAGCCARLTRDARLKRCTWWKNYRNFIGFQRMTCCNRPSLDLG
jgi:hypothetical protein